MGKLYESSKDVSRGGFRAIKKIHADVLVDLDVVSPPDGWETDKMQVKATMEGAVILEMFPGEGEFELKDGKFTCMWSYGMTQEDYDNDKKPSAGCPWVAVGVKSAEAMGKKPSELVGGPVTIERVPVKLFSHRPKKDDDGNDIEVGEDGKYPLVDVVSEDYFSFVAEDGEGNDAFNDYAREKLSGLTEKAARRKLVTDLRLKQVSELKDKLAAGTLAEFLGMAIVDGKFVIPER